MEIIERLTIEILLNLYPLNGIQKVETNLLNNFESIQSIISKIDKKEKTKYIYFNWEKINKILYDEEKLIEINNISQKLLLPYYFYLYNLLLEPLRNFSYDIDFVKQIKINHQDEGKVLNYMMILKIIDLLIEKYIENNDYDEQIEKNHEDITNKITENIEIFKEFDLDYDLNNFKEEEIDVFYSKIICYMIKMKKFENYEYASDILDQLELEKINITESMFNDLSETLETTKEYQINELNDLTKEVNINNYYILIKFIIKEQVYIYNIKILLQLRKFVLFLIRDKLHGFVEVKFDNNDIDKISEKFDYIIKFILDSEYYYKIYRKEIEYSLQQVQNYYKHYYFIQKKDEIKSIDEIIKYNGTNYIKYFNDLNNAQKYNDKWVFINLLYESEKNGQEKQEVHIIEYTEKWLELEECINGRKIKEAKCYLKYKEVLMNFFINKDNKSQILKVFSQDIYEYTINEFNKINKRAKLKEVLSYYQGYKYESKKHEIQLLENMDNHPELRYEEFEKDYEKAKEYNSKFEIVKYLICLDNDEKYGESDLELHYKIWEELEQYIKEKKVENAKNKSIVFKVVKEKENKNILIKLYGQDIFDYLIILEAQEEKKENLQKLRVVKQYYENIFIESKKNDIKKIELIISNNNYKEEDLEAYLKDYKEAEKMNLRLPIIQNLCSEEKTEEKIRESSEEWNIIENEMDNNKIYQLNLQQITKVQNIFKNKDFEEILIKIFGNEKYNSISNSIKEIFAKNILENSSFKLSIKENNGQFFIELNCVQVEKFDTEIQNLIRYLEEFGGDNNEYKTLKDNLIKLNEFLNKVKTKIQDGFIDKYNLEIILKINKSNENINENGIYNLNCIYSFVSVISKEESLYTEKNILENQTNSYVQLDALLNQINIEGNNLPTHIKQENNNQFNQNNIQDDPTNLFTIIEDNSWENLYNNGDFTRCPKEYKILEYVKIINSEKNKNEETITKIRELSNGWFISFGEDKKVLNLYNEDFKTLKEIICENEIFNFQEILIEKNKFIKFFVFTRGKAILCEINPEDILNLNMKDFKIPNKTLVNCLETKNNNLIMLSTEDVVYYNDINLNSENRVQKLNNIMENRTSSEQIINKYCRNIIEIEDNIVFLNSNEVFPNGKNSAIFYNINTLSIIKEITGKYSFNINSNSVHIIKNDKDKRIYILCACNNYGKAKMSNGILLIEYSNFQIINNEEFVDTKDFEVDCFCSLEKAWMEKETEAVVVSNSDDGQEKKPKKIENSEFFLVCGFETKKGVGKIKLCKIIYQNNKAQIIILQDLEFEDKDIDKVISKDKDQGYKPIVHLSNFNKIKQLNRINSIIQSKKNGNILVSFQDGNIHLYTAPNLYFHINNN